MLRLDWTALALVMPGVFAAGCRISVRALLFVAYVFLTRN